MIFAKLALSLNEFRNFLGIWIRVYPEYFRGNNRQLLFGIRNRMLLFIGFLVCLGLLISYLKTNATLKYVVAREKVDLGDESRNYKLAIELALETAYLQVSSEETLEEGKPIELSPLDAKRGIKHAKIKNMNEADVKGHPQVFWRRDENGSSKAYAELPISKSIARLIKSNAQPVEPNGKPTSGDFLVELDVTDLFGELNSATRGLSYFVAEGTEDLELAVGPNGDPAKKRPNPNVERVADADSKILLPEKIKDAVVTFKGEEKNSDRDVARFGLLVEFKHANFWGRTIEGAPVSELLAVSTVQAEAELWYSETTNLPSEAFSSLKASELEKIEQMMREGDEGDPYVRVDPFKREVGQIRVRASKLESLKLTKGYIELYVRHKSPDASLKWNDIAMDNFVLSVQRVDFPGLKEGIAKDGKSSDRQSIPLGYLVQSTSLDEISKSVTRDFSDIEWFTTIASVFAMVLALVVAQRLTGPLSRMTNVAEQVSELGLQRNGGNEKDLEVLLAKLPTDHCNEVGVLAKQFEKTSRDLMRAKREAEQFAANFSAEQRKVEQGEREIAIAAEVSQHRIQLLASVSHDMRQPLHVIAHYSERLLRQSELNEQDKQRIRTIVRSSEELNFLIEDILDYKRILAGDVNISVESVDLGALLDEMATHHFESARQRETKIVKINMWQGTIDTDRRRLKRVLNNLISNAIRATPGGEVRLLVSPLGVDHVEISVTDTGSGMSPLQQKLVFETAERRAQIEREQRSISSRKDSNSTGLGLYICKQLIEAMGGEIRFTSEVGKGSTFVLKLPVNVSISTIEPSRKALEISDSRTSKQTGTLESFASSKSGTMQNNRLRAVVVDDDPRCTQILSEMLEEIGYQSLVIHDGEAALKLISSALPDLVTLDVLMPGMDGWDVLRELKANRRTESIPVVMVTVHPDELQATMLGASGFVTKPVNQTALTNSVLASIGARRNARILIVDDDEECLRQLQDVLRPLSCDVLLARDGVDAVAQIVDLGDKQIDLAIIDLYMPNMDGFGLIEKLSRLPQTQKVPIIVLSAGVLSATERASLEPQVAKFFSKGSVDFATLRSDINRLLQTTSVNRENAVGNESYPLAKKATHGSRTDR